MNSQTVVHITEVDGVMHITATSQASTAAEAKGAVQKVFDWAGNGKKRFIRATPDVRSETSFETKETRHLGYVRFSVADVDGDDMVLSPSFDQFAPIGTAISAAQILDDTENAQS